MKNMVALALSAVLAIPAFSATIEEAQTAWAQRSWSANGIAAAQKANNLYGELAAAATGTEKGVMLTWQSRASYFVGEASSDIDTKVAKHEDGINFAEAAQSYLPQGTEEFALAKYFWGANKGKWGLAKGPAKVIAQKPELEKAMNDLISSGYESISEFGPHRILGKLYAALPGILGGDKVLAAYHLAYALENTRNELEEPTHGVNVNYIGEVFDDLRGGKFEAGLDKAIARARNLSESAPSDEQKEMYAAAADRLETAKAKGAVNYAKSVLEDFIAAASDESRDTPLNPDRTAETTQELAEAKVLLQKY